ncbi:hypothetical protein [Paenibacillus sp. MMS20-IR301]|uniref:hypothetical protein n=1 Tax=Paenibacillus sp. MMS20-IR301 TaxID=2895946 RepID=UPI0028EACF7D|nr:hypothetical protein [Paenibacillus sp. MMS20-IR301]WNS45040.1 hypothetical protein LOS79_07165 [Paenibacillus sp. MMS20-IR301]
MRYRRSVSILTCIIAVLAIIASGYGLLSGGGETAGGSSGMFTSIRGEEVELYGTGIYRHDSVSAAAQARAQDGVTLLAAVPLLLLSLRMSRKGKIKGQLLLSGVLGYFTYTYASYSFLAMYNNLFLIYVMLLSASLFAFLLTLVSLEREQVKRYFKPGLPAASIGGFLLFIAFMLMMLWLGRIAGPLMHGTVPQGLEHYSTLVIQALDLAVVVPVTAVTGIMLILRRAAGFLLASVVLVKAATLLTSISAMIAGMLYAGVKVSLIELIVFPVFNLGVVICLFVVLSHVQEPGKPISV